MDHAWLDSLSEDWVSQPRSPGSPDRSLPSLPKGTPESINSNSPSGRVPKYNPQKQSWITTHGSSNNPLSERSPNDYNIPLSQRGLRRPSKLRGEISNRMSSHEMTRTGNASTSKSVPCHSSRYNSVSVSPKKGMTETPEWKRRLLHGDVAYGDQRDLFSPAGLETIFRPPPPAQTPSLSKPLARMSGDDSIVLPSSPPPYKPKADVDSLDSRQEREAHNAARPRVMKYYLTDQGGGEFSVNDLSESGSVIQGRTSQELDQSDIGLKSGSNLSPSAVQEGTAMDGAGRTFSGQSDIRNEELSPIYISRHNTVDGKKHDATLDLLGPELQQRLENIRVDRHPQAAEELDDASHLQLEDSTAATDDYAQNGHFVNVRRGGYSLEGSFQTRMLSPSSLPAIDESAMLPEESMQASTPKQLPNIKRTRPSNEHNEHRKAEIFLPVPSAPHPTPPKPIENGHKNGSGSPLKLFGTYDTFTNQTLQRRLSQFEDHFDDDQEAAPSTSALEGTHPEINDAFVAASSPEKVLQEVKTHSRTSRKVNSFGDGDLDDFQFSEDISYPSSGSILQDLDKENVSIPFVGYASQTKLTQLDPSPTLEPDVASRRRIRHIHTSATKYAISVRKATRPNVANSDATIAVPVAAYQTVEDLATPRKVNGYSEGKRLPMSPLKDPTPKRRRTLLKTDFANANSDAEIVELDSLRETHQQIQSALGRKRKDARHNDDQQAANPKVLAMRQILRPRTPTPSQRSSQQHEHAPFLDPETASAEQDKLLREMKIAIIQAELDATDPLKVSVGLGMSQQVQEGSRKGSVTTQDFLDEAKKIMAGIRGKARPRNGLTSLEESLSENYANTSIGTTTKEDELEYSYQESTEEPFSRPPSRDGRPIRRTPLKQQDPQLLDHLRKYEELSDRDGVIASSMKSIALAKEAVHNAKEVDRLTEVTIMRARNQSWGSGNVIESDPPNVRITENPELRKRKHSTSSQNDDEAHHAPEFPSHGSNASSGQSTSRSVPTGSSRGSDSRRVIAPHTVSHLIPELLAGMVFDRERNMWIKGKTGSGESGRENFINSDEADDPFGDIPDLSVDETQELQSTRAVAAKRKQEGLIIKNTRDEGQEDTLKNGSCVDARPIAKSTNAGVSLEDAPSSEPSKLTRLASSCVAAESNTRLTSWGDEHGPPPIATLSQLDARETVGRSREYSQTEIREEFVEEVEKEISIHEDRVDPRTTRKRRNVTISFSSPLASVIQPRAYEDEVSFQGGEDETSQSDSDPQVDFGDGSIIVTKTGSFKKGTSAKISTGLRRTSHRLSFGGHIFSARPVSRIDERDEESSRKGDGDSYQRSVSIVAGTPVPLRKASSVVLATPRPPTHEIGTLDLTPLSDFTMRQADESFGLEVSYIARGQRYVPGTNATRTLSLSIKELVEKITEVEPFEPFWEHLKQMELKDKKLTNLHKLEDFCEKLEELDVSKNQISQLNGAPRTVRHLRITHNCLSDLTAWSHLNNLQYIDVSDNDLETLSGLKSLVHLRSLRADNNKIISLDGIGSLDGLLSLRLRGNLVESLDFRGSKLQRLTDLDLKGNRVKEIRNMQELRSLSSLNLEENQLSSLSSSTSESLWTLKYLRLSGNNLECIDVSPYPNVRLLYLDRNRLGTVTGLLQTKHLDSLSMREQQDGSEINRLFLSEAFEVRKLFLSGNLLSTFSPTVNFLNLQYLELANCGLESLPIEFGHMVSNIRVLNLNFNALRDIRPLVGIVRLKKLHLAGNRLSRLRKTTNTLMNFPSLTLVDLRSNLLTLGFYPPMIETCLVVRQTELDESDVLEPFTLGKADAERDGKYAARLDMETRTLRRVYEMLTLAGCARLKTLDGLSVDRAILESRDKVWDALVMTGVVNATTANPTPGENGQVVDPMKEETVLEPKVIAPPIAEERWQAEDSFA